MCSYDDIGTGALLRFSQASGVFLLSERSPTPARYPSVPMKGNAMTKQHQADQQNQSPGPKPGQQQGGGQKPGQQSQTPGKDDSNPGGSHPQVSDTDT
jgi:hypothetical protein